MSSFKPIGLSMLKYELQTDTPNFSSVFLKDTKLLAFCICISSLTYSEIAYGKMNIWKHILCNGMFLGPPHLIRYYKNDFPLRYI